MDRLRFTVLLQSGDWPPTSIDRLRTMRTNIRILWHY